MTDPSSQPRDRAVAPETMLAATLWHDRLHAEPGPADSAAFDAWCAADPDNARAYARVEQGADLVWQLKDAPELQALRAETRSRIAERKAAGTRRRAMAAGAAALLAIGSFWGIAQKSGLFDGASAPKIVASQIDTYRTRIGERSTITLDDGSVVHLNTQSIVHVAYSTGERRLTLAQGQALFEVAKAPQRPFVVTAGNRTVTALGTEFDVRVDRSGLQIALVEGSVVVRHGASSAATATKLKPNDVLHVAGDRVSLSHMANLRRVISWKDGLVLFEDTPLTDAVAELNRYTAQPIVIGDAKAGAIRVSGAFPTGKTANFIEAVELLFPVKARKDNKNNIVLRYAG